MIKIGPSQTAGEAISEVLRHPILKNADVSVMAVDLDRGRTIYAYEADRLLNPASVVKLFTGTAALQILRPEYRFKSTAWITKSDVNGTLAGDLIIQGGGDPTLVSERLWLWVTEMHHLGLRRVEGDLVIDESFFDGKNASDLATRKKMQISRTWRRPAHSPSILTPLGFTSAPPKPLSTRKSEY